MKKIIGIVTPILLLILPYLLFVVLSVGMGRPDRDSSGAYIMAGFQIADDADGNLHCLHGGRALKCRLGHLSDGGRNRRAGAASVGYADEAVLYPVLSAGGVYGAGGICDVYVWRSRDYRRDVDCGCPVFDTAVHLRTVRLHPGVQ